jgi:hypothetical protein
MAEMFVLEKKGGKADIRLIDEGADEAAGYIAPLAPSPNQGTGRRGNLMPALWKELPLTPRLSSGLMDVFR